MDYASLEEAGAVQFRTENKYKPVSRGGEFPVDMDQGNCGKSG
jgi:hypothetical protein